MFVEDQVGTVEMLKIANERQRHECVRNEPKPPLEDPANRGQVREGDSLILKIQKPKPPSFSSWQATKEARQEAKHWVRYRSTSESK